MRACVATVFVAALAAGCLGPGGGPDAGPTPGAEDRTSGHGSPGEFVLENETGVVRRVTFDYTGSMGYGNQGARVEATNIGYILGTTNGSTVRFVYDLQWDAVTPAPSLIEAVVWTSGTHGGVYHGRQVTMVTSASPLRIDLVDPAWEPWETRLWVNLFPGDVEGVPMTNVALDEAFRASGHIDYFEPRAGA